MRPRTGAAARRARRWVLALLPVLSVLAAPSLLAARPAGAAVAGPGYPGGGMIGFGSVDLSAPAMAEPLSSPVLTGEATPDGGGYWLASADGGVFAFGDATFEGSLGDLPLQGPIVAMAATPDGHGYWLGALDGGVFSFGDAQFYGSMGGTPLNQPIVGMAATPDGCGYWLVASDGGIFTFGDARFYGSWGSANLPDPVVGMIASPDGDGYAVTTANGVVLAAGDAHSYGGLTLDPDATPISAIIGNRAGTGYWLLDPEAWSYTFALPTPEGQPPGSAAIVAAVASQIEPDPDTRAWCNPYGPCEEWCALFATWAWRHAGIPIPSYGFVGDIYDWAAGHGAVLAPTAMPAPGDAVLYGTGPGNVYTSVHVGIVTQVWPDGAIDTVDGDSGPGRNGWLSVTINGPYLPGDSLSYNGVGIYAFAQP